MQTKKMVSIRIPVDVLARLQALTSKSNSPYAPTMTAVLERGAELALRELEKKVDKFKREA